MYNWPSQILQSPSHWQNPDDDDNEGTITFSNPDKDIPEEGAGDETDMTDTEDVGMDNPDLVLGDLVLMDDDTVPFSDVSF